MSGKEKQNKHEYTSSSKDIWDKLGIVVSKILLPIFLACAPYFYSNQETKREADMKTLELVIDILNVKSSDTSNDSLRKWASDTLEKITAQHLSPEVKKAVDAGKPLVGSNFQLKVLIIYLKGKDKNAMELKTSLENEGYNVIMLDVSEEQFPQKSQVRFYYPEDSQNAKTLCEYINNKLKYKIEEPTDKSKEQNINKHQLGELHIYLR